MALRGWLVGLAACLLCSAGWLVGRACRVGSARLEPTQVDSPRREPLRTGRLIGRAVGVSGPGDGMWDGGDGGGRRGGGDSRVVIVCIDDARSAELGPFWTGDRRVWVVVCWTPDSLIGEPEAESAAAAAAVAVMAGAAAAWRRIAVDSCRQVRSRKRGVARRPSVLVGLSSRPLLAASIRSLALLGLHAGGYHMTCPVVHVPDKS